MASAQVLTIKGIEIHAMQWGNPEGIPVLALHGWLDNAASFTHLAPLLEHCNVIAVDLPGHGLSGHWPDFNHYHMWAGVEDVELILDALGWQTCHLLGHSMGAVMATLYAATFPKRLSSLTLIEAIGPMAGTLDEAPQRLAAAIVSMKSHNSQQRPKSNLEQFIQTRLNGPLKLSPESAAILMARSVTQTSEGFCWSNDKRLKYTSMMRLPEPLIGAFIKAIECPVLGIFASDGLFTKERLSARWDQLTCTNSLHWYEGGHHLHLDGDVHTIAHTIEGFITGINPDL
jgi:pimeloyl-ACP methyl ester carboxylesterase